MRPDLAGVAQGVLTVFGTLLQFLRAQKAWPDKYVLSFGALIATIVWAFAADWTLLKDWQAFGLTSILTIFGCIGAVLGGTFGAAKLGNAGFLFPATNSK
jgi:hypothetical protein